MVTLQFVRNSDSETIIDNSYTPMAYMETRIGYPLLSFVSDTVIDDISAGTANHSYWGLVDVQATHNLYTASCVQSMFKKIFDRVKPGTAMDMVTFERVMIDFGLEIPTYSIAAAKDKQGKELICDFYFCINANESHSIIEQLCTAELYHLVKTGRIIKRCERCGKLFIPKKADEKYCIRRSEEYPDKNCKQAAKYEKQLQRERGTESARVYKSINTMLSRRAKNAVLAEKEQAETILFSFRDGAVEWKKRMKAGDAQEDEYIKWLNSFKKRKQK